MIPEVGDTEAVKSPAPLVCTQLDPPACVLTTHVYSEASEESNHSSPDCKVAPSERVVGAISET